MSFPTMKDINMDRLIDGACVTEDGFPTIGNAMPLRSLIKKSRTRNKPGHIAARQISAAYEEHASIIDSLRTELYESKGREKALIEEFTNKFKELKRGNPIALDVLGSKQGMPKIDVSDTPFDLDELPMDEMADTARMLKSSKIMEQLEQRRALEELKRQTDQEMNQLRAKSQGQIGKIQKALKYKATEIESLKKNFDAIAIERNDYKRKLEASMSTIASSPGVLSISDFSIDSPNTSSETNEQSFITPLKESHVTKRNLTPLQRLRSTQTNKATISTPLTQPMSVMNGIGGSIARATPSTTGNSPEPTSRLDALFQMVTDPSLNSMHNILQAVENEFIDDGDDSNKKSPNLSESENEFVERIKSIVRASQKDHAEVIESLKNELQKTHNVLQDNELKSADVLTKVKETQQENQGLRNELSLANASVKNKNNLEGMLRMVAVDQKSSLTEYTELKKKLRKIEAEKDDVLSEQREAQIENERAVAALRRVMADISLEKETTVKELQAKLDSSSSENSQLKKKLDPSFDPATDTSMTIDKDELAKFRQDAKRCFELEKLLETKEADDAQGIKAELDDACEIISDLEEQLKDRSREADEMVQLQISDLQTENVELREKAEAMEMKLNENKTLKEKTKQLEDDASKLRAELKQKQMESDKVMTDFTNAEGRISTLLTEGEKLKEQNSLFESEVESIRLRVTGAEEVLKTAKDVHARENQLEDELSEAQGLLDNALMEKKELQVATELHIKEMKRQESKLQNLQIEIIEMKEEKLLLRSKVREAENALEQSNRIMSLMQETADTEGTASKAILDLKQQLYEQQDLHSKLRYCCDDNATPMIDRLDRKVNTTLCLLETGILGINGAQNIAQLHFSGDASAKEQILESSLSIQRSENERIRKDIEELGTEKDQQTAIIGIELAQLRNNYDMKVELLAKKEDELEVLQSRLNGYISDGYSDTDDDEAFSPTSLPANLRRPNSGDDMKRMWAEMQCAKEKAEKEAKENVGSLANAKLIISSLEQSNQTIVENLKDRLSDSNAAIVSLLDQSKKYEGEAKQLKAELKLLITQQKDAEVCSQIDTYEREKRESKVRIAENEEEECEKKADSFSDVEEE